MPRVQWHGQTFSAKLIETNPDGSHVMEAQEHGARFTLGTRILVKPSEVISVDEAPAPTPTQSAAALQAAMDKERETLPTVDELLKQLATEAKAPA